MIYLVVPEDVENSEDFNRWTLEEVFVCAYPHETAASDAARELAKEHHRPYTVRKLGMVSFHPGR